MSGSHEARSAVEDPDAWTACFRCQEGFLVDQLIEEEGWLIPAKRCIHCGDIVDRRILRHRRMNPLPHPGRSRPRIARILEVDTPEEEDAGFTR